MFETRWGWCTDALRWFDRNGRSHEYEGIGETTALGKLLAEVNGASGCTRPYTVPTPVRASVSGASGERYSGIDETRTTCEAVLNLSTDSAYTVDAKFGCVGLR